MSWNWNIFRNLNFPCLLLQAMSHAVYIHDIGHVVVDNLQFMMGMDFTEKNRFYKQDQIVSQFRNFATEKNCHVTLIIHPRKVRNCMLLQMNCEKKHCTFNSWTIEVDHVYLWDCPSLMKSISFSISLFRDWQRNTVLVSYFVQCNFRRIQTFLLKHRIMMTAITITPACV